MTPQLPSGKLYLGLDLFRNLNNITYPGLHMEVLGKLTNFNAQDHLTYTAAVGYSQMRVAKDTIYQNLTKYYSKGGYLKAGIEIGNVFPDRIKATFGTQVVLSHYQQGGEFAFSDVYFDDAFIPFEEKKWTVGIETLLNHYFPVNERLSFIFQVRASFFIFTTRKNDSFSIPAFYIPGFGRSGSGWISGGGALQLFYQL